MRESEPVATVTIAGREHRATESSPVTFGRAVAPAVVGLDPRDMGISATAGTIEWKDLWLVVNRSQKRKLYLDEGRGGGPQPLECGQVRAVNVAFLTIEVRGEILIHRIGVAVPESDLPHFSGVFVSTGTLLPEVRLSAREREVVLALFEGYLRPSPRREPWPRTYRQAADRLGEPWTKDAVRKLVERLKIRLSRTGPPLEGSRANDALAEYLLGLNVIGPDDFENGAS